MTISEQLAAAVRYEDSLLAHALFLGIRSGLWKPDDEAENADFDKLDNTELDRIKAANLLGIRFMHLYSAPLGNKLYAMIFAENETDARKAFARHYSRKCGKVHQMSYGLDRRFYCPDLQKERTWRELRDSLVEFPIVAAEYEKD